MILGEQDDRGEDEGTGNEHHRPALEVGHGDPSVRLPRGQRQEPDTAQVEEVREGARVERSGRDAQQIDRVANAEHEEARAQQRPAAVETPSPQGEHAHDQRREEQVADRVGEVCRHGERAAGGSVQHGTEDDRGARRADAEPGDDPVEPHAGRHAPVARTRQPHEPEVAGGVQGEPEPVGHGRDRRTWHVLQPERPQQVPDRVERHADGDHDPRSTRLAHLERPERHDDGYEDIDEGRSPVAYRVIDPVAAEPDERVRHRYRNRRPQQRERAVDHGASGARERR